MSIQLVNFTYYDTDALRQLFQVINDRLRLFTAEDNTLAVALAESVEIHPYSPAKPTSVAKVTYRGEERNPPQLEDYSRRIPLECRVGLGPRENMFSSPLQRLAMAEEAYISDEALQEVACEYVLALPNLWSLELLGRNKSNISDLHEAVRRLVGGLALPKVKIHERVTAEQDTARKLLRLQRAVKKRQIEADWAVHDRYQAQEKLNKAAAEEVASRGNLARALAHLKAVENKV